MLRTILILWLCFLSTSFVFAQEDVNLKDSDVINEISDDNFINNKTYATIQILNKITAKINYINIKVGYEVLFDSLIVKVSSCWKSSPYDLSENKILLEVMDKKVDSQEYNEIFRGWMFSSSPGMNGIEHPVYDIVAINCYD